MEEIEQMLNDSSGEIIEISTSRPDSELPEWRSDVPEVIPVMPLRGVVLFPGTVAPLTVERKPSLQLLEELLPKGRLLGLVTQTFKEERDIDFQSIRNVPQAGCADAVGACLVLLDLLKLDANAFSKLLLRHSNEPPALTNALTYVNVY